MLGLPISSSIRPLALSLLLLATANVAHAVTKCQGPNGILYQNGSCPAGYTNVTASMRSNITTVPRPTPATRQQDAVVARTVAAVARERDQQWTLDQQRYRIAQNNFWAECQLLEFQLRASERAIVESPTYEGSRRYRESHHALRAQQYDFGCYG
ncbi:hypothetical protein [Cupriavidus pampae]|uniref:DUF4124 domain-containing protein n=1 Tax=Cupriavidus pampae TaxID=659251 RepID=A0ABM8XJM5_9BURK|nr:hypothetical protein [Cupriavidus pampae]CAG9180388.1 hypothetical protein LMG32289_04608 [Cupriavidus pampae]